jgi:threonyl-tRNA synthetase
MSEVQGFLKMLHEVYSVFGLDYSMALSTRPEGYLGELEMWDKVRAAGGAVWGKCGGCWGLRGLCSVRQWGAVGGVGGR